MDEVVGIVLDVKQMIPLDAQRFVDWEQTRAEQGSWSTKTMISLWFRSDTNLATMIELLRVVTDELNAKPCKLHDRLVKARLEISSQKKPLTKAHALFYKELKAVKADESKISVIYGKLQISFLVGRSLAATTLEGEGFADQGWTMNHDIIGASVQITLRHFLKPL